MGTLTANQARLPGFCEHKLPTSCRLSSIPQCCACADFRTHTVSYSVYIDGVGFVPRGTRWQRYCWFCKEFWENRVHASGLRPAQTRIPEVPDQSDFLARWYEFHQGFRLVKKEDGSEERIALLGEDFREVSPGCLPRTLEELRAGRERSALEEHAQQQQIESSEQTNGGPSLEETLEEMFAAASVEESQDAVAHTPRNTRGNNATNDIPQPAARLRRDEAGQSATRSTPDEGDAHVHAQAIVATASRNREYQARRIAALRRELLRMRHGVERVISGLRELGENVPDSTETGNSLNNFDRTLDALFTTPTQDAAENTQRLPDGLSNGSIDRGTHTAPSTAPSIQERVEEARIRHDEARRARAHAVSELDAAEEEFRATRDRFQQLQREQRSTENYTRLFGTREEMLAQGDNYVSPIGAMFTRAYDRFQAAEEIRREERTLRQVLEHEARVGGEGEARRLLELQSSMERDVWGVPVPATWPAVAADHASNTTRSDPGVDDVIAPSGDEVALEEYYALLRRQDRSESVVQTNAPLSTEQRTPGERSAQVQVQGDNFPQSMLQRVINARHEQPSDEPQATPGIVRTSRTPDAAVRSSQRSNEAEYLLTSLLRDAELRQQAGWTIEDVRSSRIGVQYVPNRVQPALQALLENEELIWAAGLPAYRAANYRNMGFAFDVQRQEAATSPPDLITRTSNIEFAAEAYQMSSEFRRRSGLDAREQLSTLYSLQAGRRPAEVRDMLESMLQVEDNIALARRVHGLAAPLIQLEEANAQRQLERQRLRDARQGDHSRQELDAQRRATQALAVAAGRTAMQTGATALFEQLANRDDETRAAYQRMRDNGFAPETADSALDRQILQTVFRPLSTEDFVSATESDSSAEDDEHKGLDANDSGRPEPKEDEDLTVRMECRICYTQLAEIACLPCGHLVMCRWCSEQHSPVMLHDRTRPRRVAGCPVCRKGIRQKVRVFRA